MDELFLKNKEFEYTQAGDQTIETQINQRGNLVLEICNHKDYQTAEYCFTSLNEIKKVIKSLQSYINDHQKTPQIKTIDVILDIQKIKPKIKKLKQK